jgi:hypothetical protein
LFLCEKNRKKLQGITERYQNMHQDILETFLDRGELRKLGEPTLPPNGKRIPGLKLDHPRQLSSLVRFSHVAAGDTFTTAELQAAAAEALGVPMEKFPLGGCATNYGSSEPRVSSKNRPTLVVIGSFPTDIVSVCCFQTLRQDLRIYAPLTAGLLHPYPGDRTMTVDRLYQLDKLDQFVFGALDELVTAVRLKIAA